MDRTVRRRRFSLVDLLVLALGVFTMALSQIGTRRAMRSVADIGGAYASGGPHAVSATRAGGVDVTMLVGLPRGLLSAGPIAGTGPGAIGLVAVA